MSEGTTLEEASRCPKCEQPGEFTGEKTLESVRGARLKSFTCRNSRCAWNGTVCRTVQVNSNGTIPPATLRRPKQFPALPDDQGRTVTALQQQLAAETGRNAEIDRRY